MNAREEKENITEKPPMELICKGSGRIDQTIRKNGHIFVGVCVGYKGKEGEVDPRVSFAAIVSYLEKLQYGNFTICLYPNGFDKQKVSQYMERIQDLLGASFLNNKVFVKGGYAEGDINLPDYNTFHADRKETAEKFNQFRKANDHFATLLKNDAGEYLKRNPGICSLEEAKEILAEEVLDCILNMTAKDAAYRTNIMLSTDENPLTSMKHVMEAHPASEILQRMRKSLHHVSFTIGVNQNKSPRVVSSKPENDSDYENNSNSNSSDSDEDNFLNGIATTYAKDPSVPTDRAVDILAGLYYKFAEKRQTDAKPVNSSSTQAILKVLTPPGKRSLRSPKDSPDESPSRKRRQSEKENTVQLEPRMTAPFFANTTNRETSNTVSQERVMLKA